MATMPVTSGALTPVSPISNNSELPTTEAKRLAKAGYSDKAIAIANLIPGQSEKCLALSNISKTLAQTDDIDRALKIAKKLSDDNIKYNTLIDILEIAAQKELIDKAVEIANSIPEQLPSILIFGGLFRPDANHENIDTLVKIADQITDTDNKISTLWSVHQMAIKRGDMQRAEEIKKTIPNPPYLFTTAQDFFEKPA